MLDPVRYAGEAEELVASATAAGDSEALVVSLRALAWVRHVDLDNEGARKLLSRGVRLAAHCGLDRRLGDLLMTRSMALQELGRYEAAARDLHRAEPLVDHAALPDLRFQLAVLDHNRGRIQAAADAYEQLLQDPACPPFVWVKAANNLANIQTLLGRPQEALGYLERAAELAAGLGTRLPAVIANGRAWSSYHAGRLAESVRLFEEAGRLHAAAGLPLGEHHVEYADVLRDLRLLDEAMAAARSASVEFERHGARLMAAEARLRCARLALELGDPATALADAQAAARDFRRQRRPAWAARARVAEAEAQAALEGDSTPVLHRLRRAAATLQRLGLREEAAYAHLAAGRAAIALKRPDFARRELSAVGELADGQSLLVRLRGHLARALLADAEDSGDVLRDCVRGLRELARHRAALPSLELRVLASGHGAELGELGLRTLLPNGSAGRIFEWLERTRAAALLRVHPPATGVDEDVVALRSVEQELRDARLARGEEPAALLARQSALEARIRRRSWTGDEGVGGEAASPTSLAGLRRALDGQWLIEYAVIGDRALAVVVEPRRTRVVELGPVTPMNQEVAAAEFGLRRLLSGTRFGAAARAATQEAIDALARLLVAPAGVPADVPLVVVPSTHLLGVPWSALHPAPVSVSPSAGLWAHARRIVPAGGARGVAVIGGPDLDGAGAEVKAVAAEHDRARTLLPPQSTAAATVALVKDVELAHFACHGRFRSDSPLFSALQLADGPLTLYEMLAHGMAPRRLVLASCHSGAQQPYGGNEVLGFASAMMSHGSTGIAAADVPIPDGASTGAMTVLHQRLARGDTMPQAVRQARAALAEGGAEEYVAWYGLTAYGPG
ncbi:CHAT domain-containing protein [Winogradskya humida]|uniref:CHAT domain-containing protein n=1 Tax=Winogradskya humida TaxID=113566 RepID=A0ABQ3ZXK7_9ACTN|nr:CHAT domain-containing tetratricopeptide repeat protein [Actinoplanes humidus]GIE23244.1 CHAT domain-containing protein [Actinoplanes humidus]